MSKVRLLWAVLKQIRSGQPEQKEEKNFYKKEVLYFQTDQLVIHNPLLAPLHIDGDPVTTENILTVKVLPAAFRLIQP